ncbi:hypothetical protein L1F34_001834 [Mammaliicoccus lentus]|nr:hypothetical protein [Mammaliicoccus lentus]
MEDKVFYRLSIGTLLEIYIREVVISKYFYRINSKNVLHGII